MSTERKYYTSSSYEDFTNVKPKSTYSSDKYTILGEGEKLNRDSYRMFGSLIVTDGKYFKMYEKYLGNGSEGGLRIDYRPLIWLFGTIDRYKCDSELVISYYNDAKKEIGHSLTIHDDAIIYSYGRGEYFNGFAVLLNNQEFEILFTGVKDKSVVWINGSLYIRNHQDDSLKFICSTDSGYKPKPSPFIINTPQMTRNTTVKSLNNTYPKSEIFSQTLNNYLDGYGFQRWFDWSFGSGGTRNSFYLGEFKGGYKHGIGAYHSANNDYYFGTYAKDKKHGFGMYKKTNGYVELNSYVNDVIDGLCFEIYDEYVAVVLYKNGAKCTDYYRIYYNFDVEICDKYCNLKRKIPSYIEV